MAFSIYFHGLMMNWLSFVVSVTIIVGADKYTFVFTIKVPEPEY